MEFILNKIEHSFLAKWVNKTRPFGHLVVKKSQKAKNHTSAPHLVRIVYSILVSKQKNLADIWNTATFMFKTNFLSNNLTWFSIKTIEARFSAFFLVMSSLCCVVRLGANFCLVSRH